MSITTLVADMLARPLPAGVPAPVFALPDQDGRMFRLKDQRHLNVLLIFYPGDNTPVCTKQLCEIGGEADLLQHAGTIAVAINRQSAESHGEFRKRHGLNIPLLVDKDGEVCRAYHAAGLFVRRTVYLIDTQGIIRFSERGRPHPQRVLASLTTPQ